MSEDGLWHMHYRHDIDNSSEYGIVISSRSAVDEAFSEFQKIDVSRRVIRYYSPSMSDDGKTLVWIDDDNEDNVMIWTRDSLAD